MNAHRHIRHAIAASLCFLALTGCATLGFSQAEKEPFEIVKSFPVSEPRWGAKVGDLYLIAAQRSVLAFKKTGPAVTDYEYVGKLYPGHNTDIRTCHIAGGRIYFGAKAEGLVAYRLRDIEQPNPQPVLRYMPPDGAFVRHTAMAGDRIYASISGGITVLDRKTFEILGQGPPDLSLSGFAASENGYLYGKNGSWEKTKSDTELAIVDARDPKNIQLVGVVKNDKYHSEFRGVPSIDNGKMYVAEFNAGVGVYDLADPASPKLIYRYQEAGKMTDMKQRRNSNALPGSVSHVVAKGQNAFVIHKVSVDSVKIGPEGMEKRVTFSSSTPRGGSGLLSPTTAILHENVLAIPTTMEGCRFYDVTDLANPRMLLNVDLPSRHEAIAKVGPMLYVTTDIDGVWQLDWEAKGGPWIRNRIPLKGLSEDLVLYKNHLYVANGVGLGIIDISDPDNPHEANYWDFPYTDKPAMSEGWVEGVDLDAEDGILYVACGHGGLAVFDLADPKNPKNIALLKPTPPIEKKKKHYLMFGHDVSVCPDRELLSYGGTDGLALFDISTPSDPKQIACLNVAGPTNNGSFSPDGQYLVGCEGGKIEIFSIADPSNPELLTQYASGAAESALFYRGYLLVPGRGHGVDVFKIGKSPADLTLVQNIPAYFYNSKFWVEGDSVFTNCQGVHELRLVK